MNDEISAQEREDIATFLPAAISRAVESYRNFSEKLTSGDAKNFSEYHKACKAALAHIELLLKLAEGVNLENLEEGNLLKSTVSEAIQEYADAKYLIGNEKDY